MLTEGPEDSLTTSPLAVVIQSLSRVRLFATPWTPAGQASLSFTVLVQRAKGAGLGIGSFLQTQKWWKGLSETHLQHCRKTGAGGSWLKNPIRKLTKRRTDEEPMWVEGSG